MDNVLTTDEWQSLIVSTPFSLRDLVLRLAVHHGHSVIPNVGGRLKWAAVMDLDAASEGAL